MSDPFVTMLQSVPPILLTESLAATLGAFEADAPLEYRITDAVKMAGHACPTVSAAFLICRRALEELYPGMTPVRGEIGITVYGGPEEGVYGVMAQVMGFITGAATTTGFDGLMTRFRRRNLLIFSREKPDPGATCFEFRRLDTGRAVLMKYHSDRVPYPDDNNRRMGELMKPVVWEAATPEERAEFQKLWMGKVATMLVQHEDIEKWLTAEPREAKQ